MPPLGHVNPFFYKGLGRGRPARFNCLDLKRAAESKK
jgi:hypothetical protein